MEEAGTVPDLSNGLLRPQAAEAGYETGSFMSRRLWLVHTARRPRERCSPLLALQNRACPVDSRAVNITG
jgi:hypothetical protein